MGSSSGTLLTSPSSAVALLLLLLSLGDAAAADAEEAGRRERVPGLTRQQGTFRTQVLAGSTNPCKDMSVGRVSRKKWEIRTRAGTCGRGVCPFSLCYSFPEASIPHAAL